MSEGPQPSIEEHLGKLENIVTSRVERLFAQHSQRESILFHDVVVNMVFNRFSSFFEFEENI